MAAMSVVPFGRIAAKAEAGIARAAGELVALLDSDDRWVPEKLALQVPLLEDPRVGLVHGGIRSFRASDGTTLSEWLPNESLDLHGLMEREWLAVNHLGGFACSTVAGLNTRKYHGLLVAAMSPPVRRM